MTTQINVVKLFFLGIIYHEANTIIYREAYNGYFQGNEKRA